MAPEGREAAARARCASRNPEKSEAFSKRALLTGPKATKTPQGDRDQERGGAAEEEGGMWLVCPR